MQVDWELSQTLAAPDGQGIRVAAVLPPLAASTSTVSQPPQPPPDAFRIITGNQGGGLCEYSIPSGLMNLISFQHDHAVTALLSDPNQNIYVTGCKDTIIRIFNGETHALLTALHGHEKPVTSLAWVVASSLDNNNNNNNKTFLVSGSWDGTAKVWDPQNNYTLVATLSGHENSVCVVGLPSSQPNTLLIATGSAGIAQNSTILGHSVRIWQVDVSSSSDVKQAAPPKIIQQITNDHDGPIRDITMIGNDTIATCSNDGTIKLRVATTGTCTTTLSFIPEQQQQSHPPMFLSVRVVGTNDDDNADSSSSIATAAEDGHVVVWKDHGQYQQVIRHTQTVWSIVPLPNGDFGTCGQDGALRIFTLSSDRMAPESERIEFMELVQAALQKQQTGPSQDEISKLPLWELNAQKRGTSEGQVQLFQKNGIAIAAQWSVASQTWIEVGQVMGRAGEGGGDNNESNLIDGVRYDHVFPIEIDGAGGSVVSLKLGYNIGENPFVAAQRFIDAHELPQYHLGQIADYIQQRMGQPAAPTIGMDTSAGQPAVVAAAAAAAMTGVPIAAYEYLPSKVYKIYDLPTKNAATTLEKMKAKILEFNLLSSSEDKMSSVDTLMATLTAGNRYHASKVHDNELAAVVTMIESSSATDPAKVFPALDLARLVVLHPDAASLDRVGIWKNQILRNVIPLCQNHSATNQVVEGPAAVAIPMLTLRLFANAFQGGQGSREAVVEHLDQVVACAELYVKSGNKNIRLSVATLLHNICHYLYSSGDAVAPLKEKLAAKLVTITDEILQNRAYEGEAVHRTLIALGTLIMCSTKAKETAKSLYMASKVEPAASPHGDAVKATAKEVYSLV